MAVDVDADVGALLKVLAEPMRWRIVELLAGEELCVCHLVEELNVAQPLISHHLRVLRGAGLVSSEKWRYWTYYRLEPAPLRELQRTIGAVITAAPKRNVPRRPCC